jgi:predicted S18 family serine protease
MTGEVTLRGRVLAIGGLKEKLLAAIRAGVKTVLFPKANEKDLQEIPDYVKKRIEVIPVSQLDEVFAIAFGTELQKTSSSAVSKVEDKHAALERNGAASARHGKASATVNGKASIRNGKAAAVGRKPIEPVNKVKSKAQKSKPVEPKSQGSSKAASRAKLTGNAAALKLKPVKPVKSVKKTAALKPTRKR